jgi:ADP-heptose:LPS heptosyltransferase
MRVLVLRALAGLGDMLCSVPALRALREMDPVPHVTLVGAPGGRWFHELFPELADEWVELRGWPGIPEAPGDASDALRQLQEVRERRFDLALQLHGDGTVTNMWVAPAGAERCGVMCAAGGWVPPGACVTYVDAATDEVARQLAVLEAVGIAVHDRSLTFPIDDRDRHAARQLAPPGPYIVVHPGSSSPARRWPAAGFAAVAAAAAKRGVRAVVTGVESEGPLATEIARLSDAGSVDLVGRATLRESAAVVAGAIGTITNDTGMSHLAAAVGTPAVVIFHTADHRRWLPNAPGHVPLPAMAPVERTVAIVMAHIDAWLGERRIDNRHAAGGDAYTGAGTGTAVQHRSRGDDQR